MDRGNYESEPVKRKGSFDFRVLDKSKFRTRQGFKLGLRRGFAGAHTKQAWNCVKNYSLGDSYKGGFEEVGRVERRRDKSKEIAKDFLAATPANSHKKTASTSIRAYISNKVLKRMEDKINKQTELELNYNNKEIKERDDEIIPQNATLYSWFNNRPSKPVKTAADNVRNARTANPNCRVKIYKKSLEANMGAGVVKARGSRKASQLVSAQWKDEPAESVNEAGKKLRLERSVRTPATNFTKPQCDL